MHKQYLKYFYPIALAIAILQTPPSVSPSVMLSLPEPLDGISPNLTELATCHPLVVRVSESNIIFHSVPCDLRLGSKSHCLSVLPPFVRHAILINPWEELNQTFYMPPSRGNGVRGQLFFPSIHPSVRHSISNSSTERSGNIIRHSQN